MSALGKPFPKRNQIKKAENQKQKIVFGQKTNSENGSWFKQTKVELE